MWRFRNGIVGVFLFVSLLTAQGFRATVVGRVTDDTGAVLPGAMITITNVGTNESRTIIVNDSGEYTIPQLAPGQYTLTAEYTGFNKVVRSGIVLETNQQARLDVVLKVGGITEEVEVSAAAPLVTTENASIGNVVDQKKIVELPLNGRDYLQLAFMQPNVFATASGSNLGFRGGLNVAGNSEIANQYILDGVDNNDETTNQPLHRPILDAVREFKILTGTYSAEYGRPAGGQIMVTTQSGTNAFHGSIWEFHRNSPLDARNFFAPVKPSFRRNQFGGVLGGPVIKDKTFFFGAYEGSAAGSKRPVLQRFLHLTSGTEISARFQRRSETLSMETILFPAIALIHHSGVSRAQGCLPSTPLLTVSVRQIMFLRPQDTTRLTSGRHGSIIV